jgi:ABC-type phosphate/phosphonate transport system ATPase subunit
MRLLTVQNLNYKDILDSVSLNLSKAEIKCIIGPNGTGKSTLIKILAGLIQPSSGTITKSAKLKIAYIPQGLGLVKNKSVLENILYGCLPNYNFFQSLFGIFPKKDQLKAQKIATKLNLTTSLNRKVYQLSGGQQKLTAIARALMLKPDLILADEILSNLDPQNTRQIVAYLKKLQQKNISILLVEHDFCLAKKLTNKIFLLNNKNLSKPKNICKLNSSELCQLYQ